jgi:hypothetical protein
VGAKIGIAISHHTDELLLDSIKKNVLDSSQLIVKRIEWKQGQVFFENTEGWASIQELIL